MYTDPAEVAVQGTEPDQVYPNSIFLPGSGVQRGSTYIGDGDPLTPTWASVDNAYRLQPEQVDGLPKIPAQPIGYDDARKLLEKMGGRDPPEGWKGLLQGIDYKLGGEMKAEFAGWKARIVTNNYFGQARSGNVIGIIRGEVEPDRYVLMSNHRDAWGYGAIDPSSGTAQLMEVVKAIGGMKANGWRPRRTMVFCSWAAEEYGLLGSYEWVFHKINQISNRAIGLVNTDICVSGPIAKPQASPVLQDVVIEGLKHAWAPPNDAAETYYDFLTEWLNSDLKDGEEAKKPEVSLLGSGSDHAPFAFYAGVPSINHRFKDDHKRYPGVGQYPTYHTGFETFYLMDKIIDPGFHLHKICAQSSIHMLLNLADSMIIPYNLERFPEVMLDSLNKLRENNVTQLYQDNGASLSHLEQAVKNFAQASKEYMAKLKTMEPSTPMELRMINDQLMQLERVFVIPEGLPGRPETRHAIFAPAKFNKYGASAFPGLSDLIHETELLGAEAYKQRWEEIKKHVSDLMIMTQNAADFLRPIDRI